MTDPRSDARESIRQLGQYLDLSDAVNVVAATNDLADRATVVDIGRYSLSTAELRSDVSDYFGRLQAPRLAGIAAGALAAAASTFAVDLSARYNTREQAIAEHLRRLSMEWMIRNHLPSAPRFVQSAADSLWRPKKFSGEQRLLMALLELLPRVDAGLLPRDAIGSVLPVLTDMMGTDRLSKYAAVWRSATLSRPSRADVPSPADWLTAARTWIEMTDTDLPAASRSMCSEPPHRGFGFADRFLPTAPTGDPLAQQMSHDLNKIAVRAQAAVETTLRTMHDMGDTLQPSPVTARAGQQPGRGIGGATVSGDRIISYRPPTDFDQTNRRVFDRELSAAGYRSPGLTKVPVPYPTGRLNTRALIAQQAQIARGLPTTATPWTAQKMVANRSEQLQFGLVVDTSATMASWTEVVAPAGWALAHAIHGHGGQCSVWGFAGEPFTIIPAGTLPAQVPVVRDSGSGSAGAAQAMAAAYDDISGKPGARVVAVLTDGKLPDGDAIDDCIETITESGGHVLWVLTHLADRTSLRPVRATILENQSPHSVSSAIAGAVFTVLAGVSN